MRSGRRALFRCACVHVALAVSISTPLAVFPQEAEKPALREYLYYVAATRNLTPERIADLRNAWFANPKDAARGHRLLRVSLSATLGRLGYGTGPFTWEYGDVEASAIHRFQSDLGIAATGTLDSLTIYHLARAQVALEQTRIYLPSKFVFALDGYFAARGTWMAVDYNAAYPINTTDVLCRRGQGCEVVYVEFVDDQHSSFSVRREHYDVISWGSDRIVAQAEAQCRQTLLTLNSATEDVVMLSQDKDGCDKEELLTMTTHLVSGSPFDSTFAPVARAVYGEKEFYEKLLRANWRDE